MARIISSRFPQRDSLLFVYGTLRPFADIPMARWLLRVASYVGPAKTRGRYVYQRDPSHRARIANGDYRAHSRPP